MEMLSLILARYSLEWKGAAQRRKYVKCPFHPSPDLALPLNPALKLAIQTRSMYATIEQIPALGEDNHSRAVRLDHNGRVSVTDSISMEGWSIVARYQTPDD